MLSVKKQNALYKDKTTSDLIGFWTNLYSKKQERKIEKKKKLLFKLLHHFVALTLYSRK